MIDITLLGTNALMPIPERALSATLLSCGGRSILFDCGEGTQTAARKAGVSLMKVDLIALTHYHGDHIFGLPGLIQTMNCMGRTDPLYITGPKGLREVMDPIIQLVGEQAYPIILCSVSEEGLSMNKLNHSWSAETRLYTFDTVHRVSSCGYRFELKRPRKFLREKAEKLGIPAELRKALQNGERVSDGEHLWTPDMVLGDKRKGISFVFTGDTMFEEQLAIGCREADLLICDATYGEDEQNELAHEHGHMTFAEAAQLAAVARVKKLCLTHYSQMISNPEECLANAVRIFKATVCGHDGMHFSLQYED